MKPSTHNSIHVVMLSLLATVCCSCTAPSTANATNNLAYKEYLAGHRLNSAGKFKEAIPHLDKAIAADPTLADAFISRGFSYGKLGPNNRELLEHSLSDYAKAIALTPDEPHGYNNRGFTLLKLNEIDQAIADFDFALKLDPDAAYLLSNRGEAYLRKGELDKAISDTTRAIELNPEDADPFATRGDAWLLQKKYAKAIKDYDSAIELNPTAADCFHDIDAIKAKRAEAKKAL